MARCSGTPMTRRTIPHFLRSPVSLSAWLRKQHAHTRYSLEMTCRWQIKQIQESMVRGACTNEIVQLLKAGCNVDGAVDDVCPLPHQIPAPGTATALLRIRGHRAPGMQLRSIGCLLTGQQPHCQLPTARRVVPAGSCSASRAQPEHNRLGARRGSPSIPLGKRRLHSRREVSPGALVRLPTQRQSALSVAVCGGFMQSHIGARPSCEHPAHAVQG